MITECGWRGKLIHWSKANVVRTGPIRSGDEVSTHMPRRQRSSLATASNPWPTAFIAATVVAFACCQLPTSQGTPAPTLRTPPTATAQPTFAPDEITALLLAATGGTSPAGSDLDELWRSTFDAAQISDEDPYRSPAAVLGYRAGDLPDTDCAREQNAGRWRTTLAKYCPSDERIVFNEDSLRSMVTEVGPDAALAILAHEWGHHAQRLLNLGALSINKELQADCFAGMYLVASGLVPHEGVESEDAALIAAVTAFFTLGNEKYKADEYFAAGEHGSPEQRIMATSTGLLSNQQVMDTGAGMQSGLPFCFGYIDYKPRDIANIGDYRFVELPGRKSAMADGKYTMRPEERTGQASSIVEMSWLEPLPGGATMAQLKALWARSWPGLTTEWKDQPLEAFSIQASRTGGKGIATPYQWVDPADSANVQSGVFGLLAPRDELGALLVRVFRNRRWPEEDLEMLLATQEQIVTLNEVLSRVCTPDETADRGASDFDPVCLPNQ
jgi:hypothetical protein